jgi:hypothetical protein
VGGGGDERARDEARGEASMDADCGLYNTLQRDYIFLGVSLLRMARPPPLPHDPPPEPRNSPSDALSEPPALLRIAFNCRGK